MSWWLWASHPNVPSAAKWRDRYYLAKLSLKWGQGCKKWKRSLQRELLRFQRVWNLSLFWEWENSVCASVLSNCFASPFPFTSVSFSSGPKGRPGGGQSPVPRNSQSHRSGRTPHSESLSVGHLIIFKALSGFLLSVLDSTTTSEAPYYLWVRREFVASPFRCSLFSHPCKSGLTFVTLTSRKQWKECCARDFLSIF